MLIKLIEPASLQYAQMVQLRVKVLLEPSGIPASYIQPEAEANDILIGAFEESQIVGCCILTKRADRILQLRQMAVDSSLQGKGAGRAIVAFAEAIAVEKDFSQIYLHARQPVVPFYEKCGYHIAGDLFYEVSIPHYRMEKAI